MKFKALMIIAVLWLYMPLQAQDNEYPTLDALANLEIPEYDYVDMTRRLSRARSEIYAPDPCAGLPSWRPRIVLGAD